MSHKDSKPSLFHTLRKDSIYLDRTKPNSSQLANDDNDVWGTTSSKQTESNIGDAILPKEPDAEDAELIYNLKSEKGRDLIQCMCKNETLKNILIDFSNDAKHPELRKALHDSIFSKEIISFDSTKSHGLQRANISNFSNIANLLETNPDEKAFISDFFVRIHSDTLVKYLLNECLRNSSIQFNSFMIDTVSRMDSEIVVPEILELQSLTNSRQGVLNEILERISQKYSLDSIASIKNREDHSTDLPLEGEELRRYWLSQEEPSLKKVENRGESGQDPEIDEDVEYNKNQDKMSEVEIGFAGKVRISVEKVIDSLSDIFESKWVNKIIRIDWIKNAFGHAIEYIETSKPIDNIRLKYEQIIHDLSSRNSVGITLPEHHSNSYSSLGSLLETNKDPIDWGDLEDFFVEFPTKETVRELLIELQNAPTLEIRERLVSLIIKMDPNVTVPAITENQFELTRVRISYHELLSEIHSSHQKDETIYDHSLKESAMIRRREIPEVPSRKAIPASNENPPDLLTFLDSDSSTVRIVTSIYRSSPESSDRHISLILKDLRIRTENGNLSEDVFNNAAQFLKVIGPKSLTRLLEEQGNESFELLRAKLLIELGELQAT